MLQPHFSPKLRILFPRVRLAQGFPQGLACSFARCLVLSTEECGWNLAPTRFASAANPRETLGTVSKNSCASGQGRTWAQLCFAGSLPGEQTCAEKSPWEHSGCFQQDVSAAWRRGVGMRKETFQQHQSGFKKTTYFQPSCSSPAVFSPFGVVGSAHTIPLGSCTGILSF